MDDPLLYFTTVRAPHTPCEDHGIGPLTWSGAEGNRTPDLLDANETRYQLRYSPSRSAPSLAVDGRLLADRPTVARLERGLQLVKHRILVVEVEGDGCGVGSG